MIRAKTIMNADPVKLQAADTVHQATRKMVEKLAKIALVFDKGRFVGALTEEDILAEMIVERKAGPSTPVGKLAHQDFLTVDPGYAVDRIEQIFRDNLRSKFVVMESGAPVGVITEIEHVAAMRNIIHYHYAMQEIILLIFGLSTAFFLFFFSPWGPILFGN